MKKVLAIMAAFLLIFGAYILVSGVAVTEFTFEGVVVEKADNYCLADTKDGLMQVNYPDSFNAEDIEVGDKIKVYFTGDIQEIYPATVTGISKIQKIGKGFKHRGIQ